MRIEQPIGNIVVNCGGCVGKVPELSAEIFIGIGTLDNTAKL